MSLDAALRMALLTGLNQTVATLTEMYADDMGVEYYETTAHPGARIEHTYWQGQVFKENSLLSDGLPLRIPMIRCTDIPITKTPGQLLKRN